MNAQKTGPQGPVFRDRSRDFNSRGDRSCDDGDDDGDGVDTVAPRSRAAHTRHSHSRGDSSRGDGDDGGGDDDSIAPAGPSPPPTEPGPTHRLPVAPNRRWQSAQAG